MALADAAVSNDARFYRWPRRVIERARVYAEVGNYHEAAERAASIWLRTTSRSKYGPTKELLEFVKELLPQVNEIAELAPLGDAAREIVKRSEADTVSNQLMPDQAIIAKAHAAQIFWLVGRTNEAKVALQRTLRQYAELRTKHEDDASKASEDVASAERLIGDKTAQQLGKREVSAESRPRNRLRTIWELLQRGLTAEAEIEGKAIDESAHPLDILNAAVLFAEYDRRRLAEALKNIWNRQARNQVHPMERALLARFNFFMTRNESEAYEALNLALLDVPKLPPLERAYTVSHVAATLVTIGRIDEVSTMLPPTHPSSALTQCQHVEWAYGVYRFGYASEANELLLKGLAEIWTHRASFRPGELFRCYTDAARVRHSLDNISE